MRKRARCKNPFTQNSEQTKLTYSKKKKKVETWIASGKKVELTGMGHEGNVWGEGMFCITTGAWVSYKCAFVKK